MNIESTSKIFFKGDEIDKKKRFKISVVKAKPQEREVLLKENEELGWYFLCDSERYL